MMLDCLYDGFVDSKVELSKRILRRALKLAFTRCEEYTWKS